MDIVFCMVIPIAICCVGTVPMHKLIGNFPYNIHAKQQEQYTKTFPFCKNPFFAVYKALTKILQLVTKKVYFRKQYLKGRKT